MTATLQHVQEAGNGVREDRLPDRALLRGPGHGLVSRFGQDWLMSMISVSKRLMLLGLGPHDIKYMYRGHTWGLLAHVIALYVALTGVGETDMESRVSSSHRP